MPELITSISRVEESECKSEEVHLLEDQPFPETKIYLVEKQEKALVAFLKDHIRTDIPVSVRAPSAQWHKRVEDRVFISEATKPIILVESDADFCTLGVAFNQAGAAVMFHQPFESHSAITRDFEDFFDTFNASVLKTCGTDAFLLVSGTNMPDPLRRGVYLETSRKITSVPNTHKHTLLADFKGYYNAEEATYRMQFRLSGVVFIPSALSISGENEIVIMSNMLLDEEFSDFLESCGGSAVKEKQ